MKQPKKANKISNNWIKLFSVPQDQQAPSCLKGYFKISPLDIMFESYSLSNHISLVIPASWRVLFFTHQRMHGCIASYTQPLYHCLSLHDLSILSTVSLYWFSLVWWVAMCAMGWTNGAEKSLDCTFLLLPQTYNMAVRFLTCDVKLLIFLCWILIDCTLLMTFMGFDWN